MKKNIFNALIGFAALAVSLASCQRMDYPDRFVQTSGVPTVDYIRYASQDVFITQAYMDELVCIVGSNLTSVHDIYFNDQKAILNTGYITANTLLVAVPSQQAVEKTDKIYLITKDGASVSVDFKVLPPAPKISSMSNEYAAAGTTATITGKYFMDVTAFEFSGAAVTDYTIVDAEHISFKVPEGAVEGPLYIETASGSGYSKFYYKDSRGMMFDFDTPNPVTGVVLDKNGWNSHMSTTDDTALSGNFFVFGALDGSQAMSSWNEEFSFPYWPGDTWGDTEYFETHPRLNDVIDVTGWASKALKFEMYIPTDHPWSDGIMQICFAGIDQVTGAGAAVTVDGKPCAGANNTYFSSEVNPRARYAPWTSGGSYDTGNEWVTVTLPLATDFVYTFSGANCDKSMDDSSFASLWIFIVSGTPAGTECSPVIKLDNIRIAAY